MHPEECFMVCRYVKGKTFLFLILFPGRFQERTEICRYHKKISFYPDISFFFR